MPAPYLDRESSLDQNGLPLANSLRSSPPREVLRQYNASITRSNRWCAETEYKSSFKTLKKNTFTNPSFAHEKISFMTLAMCIIVHRNVKAAQSPEPYDPKFQTRNNQPAVKQGNRKEKSREQGI